MRKGVLTAGGHPVHRVARTANVEPEDAPRVDGVPAIERYQDLAAAMHRTAISPKGDRFIWGCTCGEFGIVPHGSTERATTVARLHVIERAEHMYEKIEGRPVASALEES